MTKNTRFSPEVRQRAIRMVLESQDEYDSQWAAICSIAPKIGCTPETLRVWVRSELHIAPSTYYHCQQQRHHPDKRSARAQHDDWLKREIQRVYDENHQVYGVRKVWRQLLREGIRVARCTVARLMAVMGLAGVLRGKKVRTTISRKAVAAGDRVNRQFVAERPDQLWVADFTYVSTWQGFVYVAFIIDVFAG
ncbi:IS3 family transposase, partial [Escherichia coli]|uniref:IS3 family transposase n=1 Tax=Escherichia coli TaxID=562 RepID=UPI001112F189